MLRLSSFRDYEKSLIKAILEFWFWDAKLEKRVLLLTGSPGIGKTSVLLKTVEALKAKDYSVGGMISREVRSCGRRVGFEILDLGSSRRGWLAHVNQKVGPQVGKYRVNLADLDNIGAEAILKAIAECDVIAIDEIGPMELFSEKFRLAVKRAVESPKPIIGVVHWKAKHRLIDEVKAREDAEIYAVTYENRDRIHEAILVKAIEYFESKRKSD
ncbi:MAG: NTPase [Candidatus Bathyarchaeota archaeon]|nr:NTPase [Candidatus Bathyarchaeota archaeon]MDI6805519.1 NTPase [Candidatus Bathyarchaeia archaeon]